MAAAIPAMSADLKLPDFLLARAIPFYMIPYGIGALLYAPLTRVATYRRILSASFLAYAAASYLCGQSHSLAGLLAGRMAAGLAGAAAIPLGLILIGELFEKDVRGRLVGGFFGSSFFASLVGIALSGIVPWQWLFYIPAVLAALTAACFAFLPTAPLDRVHISAGNYLAALRQRTVYSIFIFIFAISFLYHGVQNWFGVYLNRVYNLDKLAVSVFFVIMAVAGGAGQVAGGYLSDKKGRYYACRIGLIALSLATMALAGKYPLIMLAAILSLFSAGWTIGHNGISTVLTDLPQDHRPEIASLNSSVRFMSGGMGFSFSSIFVEKSFSLTFLGIGALMLFSTLYLKRPIPE